MARCQVQKPNAPNATHHIYPNSVLRCSTAPPTGPAKGASCGAVRGYTAETLSVQGTDGESTKSKRGQTCKAILFDFRPALYQSKSLSGTGQGSPFWGQQHGSWASIARSKKSRKNVIPGSLAPPPTSPPIGFTEWLFSPGIRPRDHRGRHSGQKPGRSSLPQFFLKKQFSLKN